MEATTTRTEPTTTLAARRTSIIGRVQPPWSLYTLRAEASTMNSPQVPAVRIIEESMEPHGASRFLRMHTLTPDQARELGAMLTTAADEATTR